jgi:dTDP-4-dehydrorhamnose 3,5-epimerase
MDFLEAAIPHIKLLKPIRHVDSRGFFSEVFKESELRQRGIDFHFVQDNHSLSVNKGVVRGLHFQIPPSAQAKLLRVTAGSIFDVAVDIRWGSPSFGRHFAAVLSRRRLEPDLHTGRVRPWLLHASAGYRSHLQSKCLLLARTRSGSAVERP